MMILLLQLAHALLGDAENTTTEHPEVENNLRDELEIYHCRKPRKVVSLFFYLLLRL
jgi:hypothetical protein